MQSEPCLSSNKDSVLCIFASGASCDYDTIEKTTMIAIDPTSAKEDVVRTATDITELARIIDLLGSALPELSQDPRPTVPRPTVPRAGTGS
jgi:hypothetical protein